MSTAVVNPGRIGTRALAIVTSLLVALSGLLMVPAAQAAEGPSVTVTPAENLDPTVENTLTVTGTGFTGAAAANGAYLVVGKTSIWAGGGPLIAEGWDDLQWVMPREIRDGGFVKTLTIPANRLDPAESYHVATSAAHGLSVTERSLDTFFPVTVAQPVVAPTDTATTLAASAETVVAGTDVTLTASVSPAEAAGTVAFFDNGAPIGEPQMAADGAASLVASGLAVGDHSFTASFEPADANAFTNSASGAAAVRVEDKPVIVPPSPKAKVSANVTEASEAGLKVSATVENIVLRAGADVPDTGKDDQGVYVGIIEKDRVQEYANNSSAGAAEAFVYKMFIKDGKATQAIDVPADKLDRSKEYVAVSWLAHGMLNDGRFLGQADLAVSQDQWDAVFKDVSPKAKVSAKVTDASEKGLKVAVSAEDVVMRAAGETPTGRPDSGAYIGIIDKALVDNYKTDASAGIFEDFIAKGEIRDGKVSRSIELAAADLDRGTEYVAVMWRAHGFLDEDRFLGQADISVSQDQWNAVFKDASPKAKVSAKVTDASEKGLKVAVSAEDVVMRAAGETPTGRPDSGAYIGIIDKALVENYKTDASAGIFEDFIAKADIRDGKVSRSIELAAADLDRGTEYVAVMWRAHGFLDEDRFLGQADISVSQDQWNAVFKDASPKAKVSAKVTDASEKGLKVAVSAEDVVMRAAGETPTGRPDSGAYIGIIDKALVDNYKTDASAGIFEDFIAKADIRDGKVSRSIELAAADLDRGTEYVAVMWRAHGFLDEDRFLGQADISVSQDQWNAVFKDASPKAKVSAKVTDASEEGLKVAVSAEDVVMRAAGETPTGRPDSGAYIGIIDKALVDNYKTDASAGIFEDFIAKGEIRDGKVSRSIELAAADLDRGTEYVAVMWRAHGFLDEDRFLGQADISVSQDQWDAVFKDASPKAKVSAKVTDASEKGLRVSATVENIVLRAGADVPDTGKDDQGVYVGIIEKDRVQEYANDSAAGAAQAFVYKMFIKDGKAAQAIDVPAEKLDRSKEYVAVSWLAHGMLNDGRYLGQADLSVSQDQWNAVFGGTVVKPGAGGLQWGIFDKFVKYIENKSIANGTVKLHGAAKRVGNTFVFPQAKGGTWNEKTGTGTTPYSGGVSFEGHAGALQLSILDPKIKITGAKTAVMTATVNGEVLPLVDINLARATKTVGKNGELTWKGATATLRADSVEAFGDFYEAGTQFDAVTFTIGAASDVGPTKPLPKPKPQPKPQPKPEPRPVGDSSSQQAGSLSWGISSGFKGYVTGRIAKGSISTSGVGSNGGAYLFPQADGGAWDTQSQTGTVQFSGVVTFSGHKGLLTETFANPVLTVTGPTSGTLSAGGRSFGLDLGAASKSVGANGEVTWSGVPVSGAISGGGSAGGGAGGGSFGADPLSFTVGAASSVQYGSNTQTEQKAARVAAATPPTTKGIRVITPADELVPGGEIEFAAPGFEAHERDILVVLYSDPIVLDEKAGANSVGEVRWIGTLPEDIEPGEHTITLQGSQDAGAVFTVVDPTKKKKAKPVTTKEAVESSAQPQQAALLSADGSGSPVWMWWVGAAALIALAGAMGALVVNQRRNAANASVDSGSDR